MPRDAGSTGRREDLDALVAHGGAAEELRLALLLASVLRPLVRRSVPPRLVEAGPVARSARLHFADGTTVLVRSIRAGDLAALAVIMRRCSAKPVSCAVGPDGSTRLQLAWPGGQRPLAVEVLGLDQPD